MRARRFVVALAVGLAATTTAAGVGVGVADAADECNGLRVCLPFPGPWVVVPAAGVEYELACPLPGYIVAGIDARVATRDVDVSFRGEIGSPVGPGVTTRRSIVFQAVPTGRATGPSSFRPFIGCIPTRGGGGRALTSVTATPRGLKPGQPVRSIVLQRPVRRGEFVMRVLCPSGSRLIGSTHAVTFRQSLAPSQAMIGSVTVRRALVGRAVVARVTATPAAGSRAEVQVRALCARAS